MDPNNSWAWQEYARFLIDTTDRYQEALVAANKGLEPRGQQDKDSNPWPLRYRGMVKLKLGMIEEAKADLEKAKALYLKWNDTYQATWVDSVLAQLK